jgi:hypothetical protein
MNLRSRFGFIRRGFWHTISQFYSKFEVVNEVKVFETRAAAIRAGQKISISSNLQEGHSSLASLPDEKLTLSVIDRFRTKT